MVRTFPTLTGANVRIVRASPSHHHPRRSSDGKRRFSLTEEGARQVSEAAEKSDSQPWEQVRTGAPPELVNLGHAVRQLHSAIGQALKAADEDQRARITALLDETRRGIYTILSEK